MRRRSLRLALGLPVLAAAVPYLVTVIDPSVLVEAARGLVGHPVLLAAALAAYAIAFAVRALAWRRVLPPLRLGQSWAALHVALLGNHVLPLRLGEALRVTSVSRRTALPARPVVASAVTLRLGDVLAVIVLALLAAPALLDGLVDRRWTMTLTGLVAVAAVGGLLWLRRLRDRRGLALRLPGPSVATGIVVAWLLESVVIYAVAQGAGVSLGAREAVGVTAVIMVAQTVAIAPGGIGSYEAAGTAALALLSVPADAALAVVLLTHATKTAYSLLVGIVALGWPAPGYFGRFRLPRRLPAPPPSLPVPVGAPVVAFLPAHDEQETVGDVVARLPSVVAGHRVEVLVIDDGSRDATAKRAAAAGARVVRVTPNQGLGAAVRRGLAEAVALSPACVVYLDADGEYAPEDLPALAVPVLRGEADYVVGSRFTGRIEVMRPHRRLGNVVLTAWVRWLTRRRDLTDGQSGYRAFSPAAAATAEVVHNYNYAQVLTLDLLGKGFRYAEVPIRYSFRTSGSSFISLGRYLRRVVPAVHRELNAGVDAPPPSRHPPSPITGVPTLPRSE